jgi:hypothetical protein
MSWWSELLMLPLTFMAAFFEVEVRLRGVMGKVRNLNHVYSVLIGILITAIAWFSFHWFVVDLRTLVFAVLAVGVRLTFYDGFFNLLYQSPLDKVSTTTDARTDRFFSKVGFWQRRLIGAGIILVTIIIKICVTR